VTADLRKREVGGFRVERRGQRIGSGPNESLRNALEKRNKNEAFRDDHHNRQKTFRRNVVDGWD